MALHSTSTFTIIDEVGVPLREVHVRLLRQQFPHVRKEEFIRRFLLNVFEFQFRESLQLSSLCFLDVGKSHFYFEIVQLIDGGRIFLDDLQNLVLRGHRFAQFLLDLRREIRENCIDVAGVVLKHVEEGRANSAIT